MTTALDDREVQPDDVAEVKPQYQTADGQPNVALLEDRMPPALKASSHVAMLTAVLGLLFTLRSYFPLWHTDLWGHLAYGRWIFGERALPTTEPLMPLAEGVPFIDTAWLSQVWGYLMYQQFGTAGMQFLYAFSITVVAGLLAFAVYLRTRNVWAAILTIGVFYWGDYQQLLVVRPQLAGMVCFGAIFVMATAAAWKRWYTWAIPAAFLVWANVHGSFLVGLAMLAALLLGRAVDILRRTRNWRMILVERKTRGLLYALQLSMVAVLLNPYGLAIYPAIFTVSGNANLQSLIEWDALTLRMKQGQAAAAISLALICLYRLTPRRITTGEVLLLCGLGAAALWTSRMIVWWAPVAAYYFGLHLAAVWRSWRHKLPGAPRVGGLWTVVTLGLVWIFFAYTPFGFLLLHGPPQDPEVAAKQFRNSVSTQTPVAAVEYLQRNPPRGQMFNSYEWGDYLLWAGPESTRVFVASHAHLIPEEVWQDYLQIANAAGNWQNKLDVYGVNTIVIDRQHRRTLISRLEEESATWEKKYADNVAAVFVRKQPI